MPIEPPYDRAHEVEDFGELHADWAGTRVEWLDVAGARTRVLRRDGRTDGPLVLLVHGLGGAATNWLEVMEPLTAIGDVVAVDLPGFGETAPPRPTSPRPVNNARFAATLLHALGGRPAVVAGNSMGGLVATLLAADHPELVERLVLVAPSLPSWLPAYRPTAFQLMTFGPMLLPVVGPMVMRRRIQRMSFEEQYLAGLGGMTGAAYEQSERTVRVGTANLARLKHLRWRGPAMREATNGMMECLAGPLRSRTVRAMERVAAPTLYLRGSEDPLVLHATTAMVERVRPDWEVVDLRGVGHVPQVEAPDDVARRIIAHATAPHTANAAHATVTRLQVP